VREQSFAMPHGHNAGRLGGGYTLHASRVHLLFRTDNQRHK